MKLYEFQGKELFEKYGILTPRRVIVSSPATQIRFAGPYAVKAQVLFGERKKAGGILFAKTKPEVKKQLIFLLRKGLSGKKITSVLVEERIAASNEYYASFSYDLTLRNPILMLSTKGGSGIVKTKTFPIDLISGAQLFFFREALQKSGFASLDIPPLSSLLKNLWKLFLGENALLAEINPILKTSTGQFVSGDAKIILDDEKINPNERSFLNLDGDIAILASGGGASLLNVDTLFFYGGRPANYVEYSGNPSAQTVKELTRRVLARGGLKGCWVIGGTANFTDIYETMRGFLDGLRNVKPKPRYPFVIRRDGPRQKEAAAMLRAAAVSEGYDFHIFDSKTSMSETAKLMVELSKRKKHEHSG